MNTPRLSRITTKTEGYESAALSPDASVLISANAGAGKTQWLVSRVLSLLLHGVPPHRILCLTFTNAAAAEMAERVQKRLGAWVMASDSDVGEELAKLLKRAPDPSMLVRARSLFASVLEAPEGVRIQTIHGFCQSLLKRFPIEASVSPHFTVMDAGMENDMLWEARHTLFDAAANNPLLADAIRLLACNAKVADMQQMFEDIAKSRPQFHALFSQPGGLDAAIESLWQRMQLSPDTTLASLIKKYFSYDAVKEVSLKRIAGILSGQEKKTDLTTGNGMLAWFANTHKNDALVEQYIGIFLTNEGTKRKQLFTQKALTDAMLIEQLLAEQERVAQFHDARQSLAAASIGSAVMRLAQAFLSIYGKMKTTQAVMDYGDLISTSRHLLKRPGISPWVLYKLDGGIDHVLVDEAQDTSQEQWEIVTALTEDFFAGEGHSENSRSLFIVGDEKQSIFSFQGADPSKLAEMKNYFRGRIEAARYSAVDMSLLHSFRSVPEVLQAVDAVFSKTYNINHLAHRAEEKGLVEFWPLVQAEEGDSYAPQNRLVRLIADAIHGWLEKGLWLTAKNRALEPGDMMILLRTRGTFADALVRALKRRNVPVAGVDRMLLKDNLAAQDLIALGQFLLLPEDDLNLAALLKSPIGNISEDILFDLCWDRGKKSLWERLAEHPGCAEIHALLHGLRARADYLPPYELYAHALDTLALRRKILGRMGEEYADPLDEFLSAALAYQQKNIASLQGFIHWMAHSDSEIKRDMEQKKNVVRVMTVHSAKGLQAPIVILPDTVELPTMKDKLLWSEGLPLWLGAKEQDNAIFRRIREERAQAMHEEYRRLLYVAMTRAEDHLYIFGATGKGSISPQCWYELVRAGIEPLAETCHTPVGEGLRIGDVPPMRVLPRTVSPSRVTGSYNDFDSLFQPLPPEKSIPTPLAPSRLSAMPSAASPLEPGVYVRGLLIHTLLQHLPELPASRRMAAAKKISLAFSELPENDRAHAIDETLALLGNAQFTEIFSPSALAEVPVVGRIEVGGKEFSVSGQIDRLCIGKKDVWIIDYKTNRTPPHSNDAPASYLKQMALYRLLLKHIYPEKHVHCALLWTSLPRMDILDESLLKTYI